MSAGRVIHGIGTFLFLAAFALLIVPDLTAPTVRGLSLFTLTNRVNATGDSITIHYGSFGYCVLNINPAIYPYYNYTEDGGSVRCPKPGIGYDILQPVLGDFYFLISNNPTNTNGTSNNGTNPEFTVRQLSKIFAVPPVATVLSFIAFLLGLGSVVSPEPLLSILAFFLALLSFVVSLAATVVEFLMFSSLKNTFDSHNFILKGDYDTGLWSLLAATACLFFGTIFVMFTCCGRGRKVYSPNGSQNVHVHVERPERTLKRVCDPNRNNTTPDPYRVS
ncbi:hypothetical protein G7Y89_g15127 [Cudoniella acicularis]|uniref:Pali-domain-containing protein n=1 Tax=Cudoniella acicularis TaxID=354080 RepID=A0A8H4VP10_9HELO|nr:hypothetical protein G7Y89_g15127 [Cudoniella acicularis]